MADQTIDRVQLELKATSQGATEVISGLVTQLNALKSVLSSLDTSKLKTATSGAQKVNIDTSGLTKSEKEVRTSIDNIKKDLAGLKAIKDLGISGDKSSLISAQRKLATIQSDANKLAETFKQAGDNRSSVNIGSDMLQGFRTELADLQSLLNKSKSEIDSAVAVMNSKKIKINTGNSKKDLDSLGAKAKKVAGNLLMLSGKTIATSFKNLGSGIGKIRTGLSDIGNRFSKFANTGLMKILRYGFGIRSLYVLFRRLKEAIKDSFGSLQSSGAMFETTRANITALKNSLQTLKFQFGAAFEPIFNAIAPALQTLINYLVTVMNVISAFTAKLMGRSTYSKVSAVLTKTGSAAGGAAKNVKELNHQLQGFDELNNLTLDPGNSGGGGGGGGGGSDGAMYEPASVDDALGDFAKELADKIRAGDWEGVGLAISEKLTGVLENIPWDNIFQKAANFGTNFANFLNGLITDDLFYQLGRTLANSIKTALIATLTFGTTFDWEGLGTAVASGIEGFVDQNPLQLLAENFDTWANGILDAIIVAIDKLQEDGTFEDLGEHIANAINTIDIPEKLWKLAQIARSLLSGLASAIRELWGDLEIQNQIGLAIVGMVAVAKLTGLSGVLAAAIGAELLGKTLTIQQALSIKLAGVVVALGGLAISDINLGSGGLQGLLEGALFKLLGAVTTYAGLRMIGLNVGLSLKIALVLLAAGLGWEGGKAISQWVAEKLSGTQGINAKAVDEYIEISKTMTFKGVISDVALAAKQGNLWDAWVNMVSDWFEPLFEEIEYQWGELKKKIKNIPIIEALTGLKNNISSIWSMLTGGGNGQPHGYNGAPSDAVEYIEKQNRNSYWKEIGANIVDGIANGIKLSLRMNPFTEPIVAVYDAIKKAICDKFGIHSPAKAMFTYGESILQGIVKGFRDAIKKYVPDALIELYEYFNGGGTTTEKQGYTAPGNFKNGSSKTHNKTGQKVTINTQYTGDIKGKNGLKDAVAYWTQLMDGITDKDSKLESSMLGAFTSVETVKEGADNFRALDRDFRSKNATYTTNMGGQITSKDQIDSVRTQYENLYNAWNGKASRFDVNTGGQLDKFGTLDTWRTKFTNLFNSWLGKSATMSANIGGQMNKIGDTDTWVGKIKNLFNNWVGRTANFNAGFNQTQGTIAGYASQMQNLYNSWTGRSASFDVTANVTGANIDKVAGAIVDRINKGLNKSANYALQRINAKGGIFANGGWHNIPQYASGTSDALSHGSVFVAGERGSEIVGNINGRTEVLNRSQIAATIKAATVSGMRLFRGSQMVRPPELDNQSASMSAYGYEIKSQMAANNDAIFEQNRLLQEQNTLLREIANKELTVSTKDVFDATKKEAKNYYNRTGNSPFLY